MFCFDLKVFGLNRERSTLPQTISGTNQIDLLCNRIFGPKQNNLLSKEKNWGTIQKVLLTFRSEADQMKTFCFCSDNKLRYQNISRFVSISLTFLVSSDSSSHAPTATTMANAN